MTKVVCVLYEDPVDGFPDGVPEGRHSPDRSLPRRANRAFATRRRLRSRATARQRVGRAGPARIPGGARPHLRRDLRQGRARLCLRPRAGRRRGRHLAAVLAGLPHRRAHRRRAEPEAGDHRGHRVGPRRPAGGDRPRDHRRRGDVLQQHQRGRARGDDDPVVGAQLHPVVPVGREAAGGTSPTASSARTTSKA